MHLFAGSYKHEISPSSPKPAATLQYAAGYTNSENITALRKIFALIADLSKYILNILAFRENKVPIWLFILLLYVAHQIRLFLNCLLNYVCFCWYKKLAEMCFKSCWRRDFENSLRL
jgi:hypothetical protein